MKKADGFLLQTDLGAGSVKTVWGKNERNRLSDRLGEKK